MLLAWQERLTTSPLIPPSLFRQPSIWRADAMAACHGAALVSLITFLPIYLRAVRGASPAETGLMLLPLTAGIGIGSMITGQMVTRTGYTAVFPTYGLMAATVGLVCDRVLDAASDTGAARLVVLRHRVVHGHRHGRRPGHGAGGVRTAAARHRRGHGAVLPLGRRRFRHGHRRARSCFRFSPRPTATPRPCSAPSSNRDRMSLPASRRRGRPAFMPRSAMRSAPPFSPSPLSPASAPCSPGRCRCGGCDRNVIDAIAARGRTRGRLR